MAKNVSLVNLVPSVVSDNLREFNHQCLMLGKIVVAEGYFFSKLPKGKKLLFKYFIEILLLFNRAHTYSLVQIDILQEILLVL